MAVRNGVTRNTLLAEKNRLLLQEDVREPMQLLTFDK